MQNQLQKNVTLNPSYNGNCMIEEYLRKMKSHSSLGRMISTYNKRYFVLDLTSLVFCYMPEKGSPTPHVVDIPLDSITRIYIDAQLQLLGDGLNIWKHGFVIVTRKRVFRLIAHSNTVMEKFLFGFAQVINTDTNRPLFDWSAYTSNAPAAQPYVSTYKMKNINDEEHTPSAKSPSVIQNHRDDSSFRKDTEPSPMLNKSRRNSQSIQPVQPEKDKQQPRGENIQGNHAAAVERKSDESLPQVKENMMFRGNTYGKTTVDNDSELRQQYYNNRIISLDESPKHAAEAALKTKVEVVSLDEPDIEVISRSRDQRRSSSVRRDSSVRRNSSAHAQREQGSATITAVQARKNESEIGFVGFNQVDLAQYQKKKTSSHFWDEDPIDKSASKISLVRQRTKEYPERKMNIGNGIQVSYPKFEEISGKQDLPASYINMMQEAKKFSPVIHDDRGREAAGPVRGIDIKPNGDDDWDKEMFGEENNKEKEKQSKSMGKGIYQDFSSNTLTGYQDPRLSQVKKNQLCHKKSEIMASREEAYNDWDDDL